MAADDTWTTDPLALCLSGGGYRAAAFHLGTLHYLDRVGLLGNLGALSTISGGSLLGAMYLLSLADGKSFEEFFARSYGQLREVDLIADSLRLLKEASAAPSKRRNVITSVAEVYSRTFFAGNGAARTLGELLESDRVPEFSINATEFRTGRSFRFRKSQSPRTVIGAKGVRVPREQAADIRIADIVASSACFPGGFEPLEFPDDYVWPGGEVPEEVRAKLRNQKLENESVALMDGGVYDNQGASILDRVVGRRVDEFGMFVISDVDQKSDELFGYPENPIELGGLGKLKLSHLGIGVKVTKLVCLLSALALLFQAWSEWRAGTFSPFLDVLLYLVPLILVGGAFFALRQIENLVATNIRKVPKVGADAWNLLRGVTINQLAEMVGIRFGSLLGLASSVFMKRIRGLVYTAVISDGDRWWYQPEPEKSDEPAPPPEERPGWVADQIYELDELKNVPQGTVVSDGDRWWLPPKPKMPKKRPRWIANQIYEIEELEKVPQGVDALSDDLRAKGAKAAATPTTLWFDDESELRDLVACGQASICLNLIDHIVRRHGDDPAAYPEPVQKLWDSLVADWKALNDAPESLLPSASSQGRTSGNTSV